MRRGRRKLDQYTRYGALVLAGFQSFGVAMMLEGMNNSDMGGGRSATWWPIRAGASA